MPTHRMVAAATHLNGVTLKAGMRRYRHVPGSCDLKPELAESSRFADPNSESLTGQVLVGRVPPLVAVAHLWIQFQVSVSVLVEARQPQMDTLSSGTHPGGQVLI